MLLVWVAHVAGAGKGLQATVDALAAKLGLSRAHLYRQLGELERRGDVRRWQRFRRYSTAARDELPRAFWVRDAGGHLVPPTRWRDADGGLHTHLDVRGVTYASLRAVKRVLAVERGHRGQPLEQAAWTELWGLLKRSGRALRARLATAPAQKETAYNVESSSTSNLYGPARMVSRAQGPPSG